MNEINQYLKNNKLDLELKKDRISSPEGDLVLNEKEVEYFKNNLETIVEEFKEEHSMEDEYRLKRAFDQGFNTDKVYYHGTDNKFSEFNVDKIADSRIWLSENKEDVLNKNVGASGAKYIKELYIRETKIGGWDEEDRLVSDQMIQEGYNGIKLDDYTYLFNPKDLRSIDASFNKNNIDATKLLDEPEKEINTSNVFEHIEDTFLLLKISGFVNDKTKSYSVGEDAFNSLGEHLGVYVEKLSDFIGEKNDIDKFKKALLENGATEVAKSKYNENSRQSIYGYRKAYTEKSGSVDQYIIKDSTGDLSWINLKTEDYTFSKVENKRKRTPKV